MFRCGNPRWAASGTDSTPQRCQNYATAPHKCSKPARNDPKNPKKGIRSAGATSGLVSDGLLLYGLVVGC